MTLARAKQVVRLVFSAGLLAIAAAQHTLAQSFPTKPIRIIVGVAAGGNVDLVARAVAQQMSEAWKQPVVVVNRPGAGGNIGADAVAKAPTDGYTLLLADLALTSNVVYYKKQALPDPLKAFVPVAVVADTPTLTPPCGACRQILWEFCGDVPVTLVNLAGVTREFTVGQLLPEAFDDSLLG